MATPFSFGPSPSFALGPVRFRQPEERPVPPDLVAPTAVTSDLAASPTAAPSYLSTTGWDTGGTATDEGGSSASGQADPNTAGLVASVAGGLNIGKGPTTGLLSALAPQAFNLVAPVLANPVLGPMLSLTNTLGNQFSNTFGQMIANLTPAEAAQFAQTFAAQMAQGPQFGDPRGLFSQTGYTGQLANTTNFGTRGPSPEGEPADAPTSPVGETPTGLTGMTGPADSAGEGAPSGDSGSGDPSGVAGDGSGVAGGVAGASGVMHGGGWVEDVTPGDEPRTLQSGEYVVPAWLARRVGPALERLRTDPLAWAPLDQGMRIGVPHE